MGNMATETPAASGTGETPGTGTTPPAGAQNAVQGGNGTPETVPYSRFKEVNDQLAALRPYQPLLDLGLDADSLRQLAGFEAAYLQNPVAVLTELVNGISDLPQDAKTQISGLLGSPASPPAAAGDTNEDGGDDDPPAWAKPLIEDYQSRQTQSAEQARSDKLDEILQHWNKMDEADGIAGVKDSTKLAFISVNAPHGKTTEEIAKLARADYVEQRTADLAGTRSDLRETRAAGSPLPAPDGAGVPVTTNPPKTLAEASAAVKAALESGTPLGTTPTEGS